ncbi:nucleoside phosphorylase [Aquimarina sp. ERC-38]|uniref:nucleoside phosphorylase n=1 Tax=Aquimarina sp. ERC-38 TaxID=2949996 RepID=UPI002246DAEB|nr:nucleoside phosphorylase [Aquimarina sp. ERC-38]UZO80254.1 nucleoside phosphorylase [Aquimarina sp. ERC-38]
MHFPESELILNKDGSVYHLNLHPNQISDTIITVGDPDRVPQITKYFDKIYDQVQKREFHTTTGAYNNKRITVISTGIGTDNIDIVLNELDALVNIDIKTRKLKEKQTSLNLIRIGTSGAIQPDIKVNSFLLTETAIGLDALLPFYKESTIEDASLFQSLQNHFIKNQFTIPFYMSEANKALVMRFEDSQLIKGVTLTNPGFYAPQGRALRLPLRFPNFNQMIRDFTFKSQKITNLEMETAGIYGLANLLGHRAISLNAILANRATHTFSKHPDKTIEALIVFALEKISNL